MQSKAIAYKETGYFSNLICDYLNEEKNLQPFYNNFPKLENFKKQIEEKQLSFGSNSRHILSETLKRQYNNTEASAKTLQNIEDLKQENTFTITTGHQLNLFTGPLYFLYKIVSTINLTTQLKEKYPNCNFVPVYWMATEDHDFDEIKYFNFKGKKIQWNKNASGAVGELSTEGLDNVFEIFSSELGLEENANALRNLFQTAYLKHANLAAATQYLANALFAAYGLVIVDANNKELKQLFVPYIKEELENKTSFKTVTNTSSKLDSISPNYKVQVNPREINLFYIESNIRERIVYEAGTYKVLNTNISWSKKELLKQVKDASQKFSPNVILRPLYQEVILPNLCYIGGGGELAYWLQLKDYFNKVNVVFPMLLLRNSVLIKTKKQEEKLKKLQVSLEDTFLKQDVLINKKVKQISSIEIDFSKQLSHLKKQFKDLYAIAEKTDKSFVGAVAAQEKKQINGLQHLEKRLLTAQKRKLKDKIARITEIQEALFPKGSLQERNTNFSQFYLEFGEQLVPKLIETLKPLQGDFTVLTL
ncbi:MAG: bacillithiol biosynthesis cysteine-adding enzyme BshC [Oceanihabitans sp.]